MWLGCSSVLVCLLGMDKTPNFIDGIKYDIFEDILWMCNSCIFCFFDSGLLWECRIQWFHVRGFHLVFPGSEKWGLWARRAAHGHRRSSADLGRGKTISSLFSKPTATPRKTFPGNHSGNWICKLVPRITGFQFDFCVKASRLGKMKQERLLSISVQAAWIYRDVLLATGLALGLLSSELQWRGKAIEEAHFIVII